MIAVDGGTSTGGGSWDPTYQYRTAGSGAADTDRLDTHMLSVYLTVEAFPQTAEDRLSLARTYGPYLVQEWVARGLPLHDLYYLVHLPGELGPSEGQRIHRADQAAAMAREQGGEAVVLVLANTPVDPDLVVSKVHFD